jgi:23S rRNA pseudouridine1911/1915/1917 synthase
MTMPADRTYHIRPVLDGQTLAAALRRLITDLSWADARQMIAGRRVQVNGNLTLDEARRLKSGDVVKVFEHARAPVPTQRDVRVRHVDADLIVVEKPPGITTLRHAEERDWDDRRKQRQPTLDEVVQRVLADVWRPSADPAKREAGSGGGDVPRSPRSHPLMRGGPPPKGGKPRQESKGRRHTPAPPPLRQSGRGAPFQPPTSAKLPKVRPVHRLDRDTSGLMLFALSPRAEQALVKMFKGHDVRRAYLAVVHGRLDAERTIESWLVRDRGDGLRGSSTSTSLGAGPSTSLGAGPSTSLGAGPRGPGDPDAKHAVTHVRPVEHLGDDYTIVECRLETGRTHQIRIHLSEIGHMLCGEQVYTRPVPGAQPVPDRSGAPRHALHSAELEFTHPVTGQEMRFTSPWPKDLAEWLGRLKG